MVQTKTSHLNTRSATQNTLVKNSEPFPVIISKTVFASLAVAIFAGCLILFQSYPQQSLFCGLAFVVFAVSAVSGPFYGITISIISILAAYFVVRQTFFLAGIDPGTQEWVGFFILNLTIIYCTELGKTFFRSRFGFGLKGEAEQHETEALVKDKIKLLVWACRSDGSWEYVSRRWSRYTGLTLAQINSVGCETIIHPDDVEQFSSQWSSHLDSPEPFQVPFRIKAANGSYHQSMTEFIPDQIEAGLAGRWILATHLYSMPEIQQSNMLNESYQDFLEATPYLTAKIDRSHRIININKNFISFFNVQHDYPGKSIADLVGMQFYSEIQPYIENSGIYHEIQVMNIKTSTHEGKKLLKVQIIPQVTRDDLVNEFLICFEELSEIDEERYAKAENFDEISVLVWTREPTNKSGGGRILQANKKLLEFTGLSEEEIKDGSEKLFFVAEDYSIFQSKYEDAARKRVGFEVDLRLTSSKGEVRPCTLRVTPVRGEQGRITGWMNVGVERSQTAWDKAGNTEYLYNAFGNVVPNYLLVVTADFAVEYSNSRWQNHVGQPTFVDNWIDYVHSDDQEKLKKFFLGVKQLSKSSEMEARVKSKKGEFQWFVVRAMPMSTNETSPDKFMVTLTNIDSRKKSEEELKRKNRKFNLALETGKIGIWEFNASSSSVSLAGKAQDLLGFPKEIAEISITRLFKKICKSDRVFLVQAIRRALKDGKEFRLDVRATQSQGSVPARYLNIFGTPAVNFAGEAIGLLGTILDVTEHKEIENKFDDMLTMEKVARREAERRGALKDQFLASVSTELKTPINAIVGWSQSLQREPDRVDDYLARLKDVEKNAQVQAQLVEGLLEVSRIVSGSIELSISQINFYKLFSEVIETFRNFFAAKGIRYQQAPVAAGIEIDELLIQGDHFRLQQALWNCINAISSCLKKGDSITSSIRSNQNWLEILLELRSNILSCEKIISIFNNAENWESLSLKEEKISAVNFLLFQYLISFHLGNFKISADDSGNGVKLTVKIPTRKDVVSTGKAPAISEDVVALDGKRVLLLHSDPILRREISKVLEGSNAEVLPAGSIHDAIEVLETSKADIVLTDLSFEDPGFQHDGKYSFIRKIKDIQNKNREFVPTVALSGLESKPSKLDAVANGYQACVSGPIEPERLLNLIADLVKAN